MDVQNYPQTGNCWCSRMSKPRYSQVLLPILRRIFWGLPFEVYQVSLWGVDSHPPLGAKVVRPVVPHCLWHRNVWQAENVGASCSNLVWIAWFHCPRTHRLSYRKLCKYHCSTGNSRKCSLGKWSQQFLFASLVYISFMWFGTGRMKPTHQIYVFWRGWHMVIKSSQVL